MELLKCAYLCMFVSVCVCVGGVLRCSGVLMCSEVFTSPCNKDAYWPNTEMNFSRVTKNQVLNKPNKECEGGRGVLMNYNATVYSCFYLGNSSFFLSIITQF